MESLDGGEMNRPAQEDGGGCVDGVLDEFTTGTWSKDTEREPERETDSLESRSISTSRLGRSRETASRLSLTSTSRASLRSTPPCAPVALHLVLFFLHLPRVLDL